VRADLDTLCIAVYCAARSLFPGALQPKLSALGLHRGRTVMLATSDVLALAASYAAAFIAANQIPPPAIIAPTWFMAGLWIVAIPVWLAVLAAYKAVRERRPFVVYEDDQITGWASRRLDMTPAITGLWQVLGRNDMPFDEMVKLDYLYVTNWSLWWDVKILCQTLPVVLGRRGAY